MKEWLLGVWVVLCLLLATAQVSAIKTSEMSLTYTPHAQIVIYSDSDFTAENGVVGGNGTPYNPYIIEGWDIDISDPSSNNTHQAGGIVIGNAHAYFVVRNVKVHGDYEPINTTGYFSIAGNPAVWMYFGAHARIENCILTNTTSGIMMTGVDGAVIRGNTITGNTKGIQIDNSLNINIEENYVAQNQFGNIDLSWISNAFVKNNSLVHNDMPMGMNLYDCENCDVLNNTISDNSNIGLNIGGCRDCRIMGNTVTDSKVGITIYDVKNVVLDDNEFSNNQKNIDAGTDGNSHAGPAIDIVALVAAVALLAAMYLLMKRIEGRTNPP